MKLNRIYAIILRHLFLFRHSISRLTDAFYWGTLDLVLWGTTSTYFIQVTGDPKSVGPIIFSLLLWIFTWRGQYELTVNLLEEIWNKNLVNLFVAPLSFNEWISGLLSLGVLKSIVSVTFTSIMALIFFKTNIFDLGYYLFLFIPLLIMNGWWLGLLISSIIMRFGTRVESFAWSLVWVISPFAAVYFPLSILPEWAQLVAKFIPASYVFEVERELVKTSHFDATKLLISLLLNLLYLCIGFLVLKINYEAVRRKKGLVKVD